MPSPGFWFHPVGCDCLYNPRGFLVQECFQCEEAARRQPVPRYQPTAEEEARWQDCEAT